MYDGFIFSKIAPSHHMTLNFTSRFNISNLLNKEVKTLKKIKKDKKPYAALAVRKPMEFDLKIEKIKPTATIKNAITKLSVAAIFLFKTNTGTATRRLQGCISKSLVPKLTHGKKLHTKKIYEVGWLQKPIFTRCKFISLL